MPHSRLLPKSRLYAPPLRRTLLLEMLEARLLLSGAAPETEVDPTQALQLFAAAPALFVENVGQIDDPAVRYAFYGDGANIYHTTQGPLFLLSTPSEAGGQASNQIQSCVVAASFVGADKVEPVGSDLKETQVNYYVGGGPDEWHTGVPTYSIVEYPGLYNGIDLYTYGRRDSLKYEFHVAPGADPSPIAIRYEGIQGLSVDESGALHVATPLGELVDAAPVIYQDKDGTRTEIAGQYVILDNSTYTVTVTGDYDRDLPLVIDPNLAWAAFLGGQYGDAARGIAVDGDGNVIVVGVTASTDFPVAGGMAGLHVDNYVAEDAFITKIKPDGSAILWSGCVGGIWDDEALGVAVSASGDIAMTGITFSTDFPQGAGFGPNWHGEVSEDKRESEAFLTKFSGAGQILWSGFLGGSQADSGAAVAFDPTGNILVAGGTWSSDFSTAGSLHPGYLDNSYQGAPVPPPPPPGQPAGSTEGCGDAFVAKVSANGGSLLWSGYMGGSMRDTAKAIATDAQGNVYVAGYTRSSDFPGLASFDTTYNGAGEFNGDQEGGDAFVAKIRPDGTEVLWSALLGGSDTECPYGLAVDANGDVVVAGYTGSSNFPVVGNNGTTYSGDYDGFVTRIAGDGSAIVWSRYLGGTSSERSRSVALDPLGNAIVAGNTMSEDFPTTPDAFQPTAPPREFAQYWNGTVTKLDAGGQIVWSTYLGGTADDACYGVAVLGSTVFVAGETWESTFPVRNSFGMTFGGPGRDEWGAYHSGDGFVARITAPVAWTVLYYGDGDNNLEQGCLNTLQDLEQVDYSALSGGQVQVVVQIDRIPNFSNTVVPSPGTDGNWTDTRRGVLVYDGDTGAYATRLIPGNATYSESDMGHPASLTRFINWGMTVAPAQHYMLVLDDHGGGWEGLSYDDTSSHDRLTMAELRTVFDSVPYIDNLVLDMCLMQMTEVSTELIGEVGYLSGSEEVAKGGAHRWDQALGWLARNPGAQDLNVAQKDFQSDKNETWSYVDVSRVTDVNSAIDSFASTALASGNAADWDLLRAIRDQTRHFKWDWFRDLGDYMQRITAAAGSFSTASIASAAQGVLTRLSDAVPEHNGDGATGMSIYLPPSGAPIKSGYSPSTLTFCGTSPDSAPHWRSFLFRLQGITPQAVAGEVGGVPASATPVAAATGKWGYLDSSVDTTSDVDCYSFNASAGDVLYAETDGAGSAGLSPVMTLIAPNGSTLAAQAVPDDDGEAKFSGVSLTQAGTYYVAVTSAGNADPLHPTAGSSSGAYSLALNRGSPSSLRPVLSLGAASVPFGTVLPGVATPGSLALTNNGQVDLVIAGLTLSADSPFQAGDDKVPLPFTLGPGETLYLPMSVQPVAEGNLSDTLHILSNDPVHPDDAVSLQATAAAPLTSYDQYLLELVNRARANPSAEAARYGIALNEGVPADKTISTDPKQPLAPNLYLVGAAQGHSQWMIDTDTFSHTGSGGTNPGQRMTAAGYEFLLPWGYGENIGLHEEKPAVPALTPSTATLHEGLFVDEGYDGRGHRVNILNPDFKEIGTGIKTGDWGGWNAVDCTEDFANEAGDSFLTGVAYNDKLVTDDDFYTPGEGLGGVTVTATRASDGAVFTTATWSTGGYELQLPAGVYTVTGSGPGISSPIAFTNVTIADKNVKRDFVVDTVPLPVAEIAVQGLNGLNIADGDATPGSSDGTDFGTVQQGATGPTRTFTVRNTGAAALTLGTLTIPPGFAVTEPLSASIPSGGSDTFTLQLSTAGIAAFGGDVSFSTNDGDGGDGIENPFNFRISGTVIFTAPTGDAYEPDDSSSQATSIAADGTPQTHSIHLVSDVDWVKFTLAQRSDVTLETAGPSGNTVIDLYGPNSSSTLVASDDDGGIAYFSKIVRNGPEALEAGTYYLRIHDYGSVSTIPTYTVAVTAAPAGTGLAEIVVEGLNGQNIADGDASPSDADGTDFGSVLQGAPGPMRTFTVRNTGAATLVTDTIALSVAFDLIEPLDTYILPGASDTFTIQLSTSAAGAFTEDVSFTNSDGDGGDGVESPFNFTITGTVTALGPGADSYEPDDLPSQASTITTDGAPQTHSIHVAGDTDWVKFTLNRTSAVTIETDGPAGDTEMYLSGPDDPATFIMYNDDGGNGYFSTISRTGDDSLAPGTYYVAINEYDNDGTIPSYTLSVSATPLEAESWLPVGDSQHPGTVFYTEPDGTAVTLTLKSGSANLCFTGSNLLANIGKNSITVTNSQGNGRASLEIIELSSTTPSSSLSITTRDPKGQSAGSIGASLGAITGSSSLGALTAKTVDLVGEGIGLTGDAYISSVQLRDLRNGADIVMAGAGPVKGVSIKASHLGAGSDITLGAGLKSLSASDWADGLLTAPWATAIAITSDCGADIALTNADAKGVSAGSLTVGGALNDVAISAPGAIRTLNAAQWTGGSLTAAYVEKFAIKGSKTTTGDLTDVQISLSDGSAKGLGLGSATIAGSLSAGLWNITGAMGNLTVKGAVDSTTIRSTGSMGAFTLGAAYGSDFLAGINSDCDRCALDHGDFSNSLAALKSLKIVGWKVAKDDPIPRFFEDSNISAASIGSVSLLNSDWGAGGGIYIPDEAALKSCSNKDTDYKEDNWTWKPGKLPIPDWIEIL